MDITTANRLYELRKQHGYSQDELADMLGVSRQAVSKWERSESSPDTDNLIALARLYSVSLDELLGFEKSDDSSCSDDNQNCEENTQNDVNNDKNDTSSADCDDDTMRRDSVHIDENGIHIKDKNGEQVHITGGIAKFVNNIVGNIHVDNNDDDDDDDDDCDMKDIHIAKSHIRFGKDNKVMKLKAIFSACAMTISIATYLVIGFVCNLWHPGWLVFFFPFIVDATIETIIKKDAHHFPIPIIVTAVYLLMGFVWNLWHPGWIIFCALPVYYIIVSSIKAFIDADKAKDISIDIQADESSIDVANDENN